MSGPTVPAAPWAQVPPPAPPTGPSALRRAVHRLAAPLVLAGTTVVAVALVVLPWAVQRVVRVDPLDAPPGWTPRRRRATSPTSRRTPVPARGPRTGRRLGLGTLAVVVLAGLTPWGRAELEDRLFPAPPPAEGFRLQGRAAPAPATGDLPLLREPVDPDLEANVPAPGEVPAAHRDDPWFTDPAYDAGQGHLLDPRIANRPVNPYQLLDLRSRYVNVQDGRRVSWTAPPCACRRLTVWLYGGSTTFGLDQRDDHTIASELARLALDHGLVVDVHNRGQLGHLHWMEAERFAWDLTREDPPDLVAFYDGVNDQWATNALNDEDAGDIRGTIDPTTLDLWRSTGRSDGPRPPAPPGATYVGRASGGGLEVEALTALTVERYDRARTLSAATGRVHDLPIRYYWQPNRFSRPIVPEEPHGDAAQEDYSRLVQQLLRDQLPADVVDLSDALDGSTDPLFTDEVHHNEQGARLVAEAMFRDLRPALEALQRAGSGR